MPKVSIIVPVYNVEKYLSRCLDSLLNQTEKDIEIIIVNDGTKDNSQMIIDDYVKHYPNKIKSLKKNNGGLSDARNFGIPHASGEYIGFVDSDDYVETNMYEVLLKQSDNGKKKIVACGYYMDWSNKTIIKMDHKLTTLENYVCSGLVVAWNKIYKREWLVNTNIIFPKGLLYEDTQFFCQILTKINSVDEIGIVDKPLVHYIQREDSISYSNASKIDDIHDIALNVIDYYDINNVNESLKKAIEYKFVKTLLGNFMIKYMRITDRKKKKIALKNNWIFINNSFPNWKKNIYIKSQGSVSIRIYLKSMNCLIYKLISSLSINMINTIINK